jgi:hypothetical protein
MHGNWNTAKIALLAIAAALLVWLGASIPVHFRAISRLVLEEAGKNTRTAQSLSDDYLLAGKPGPLALLWDSQLARPSQLDRTRAVGLIEKHLLYRHTGGPAPLFEDYLAALPMGSIPADAKAARVAEILLPEANAKTALARLRQSANGTVDALLEARAISQWRRFMPVTTPAGRPLEAAILTLALEAEADNLRPEFAKETANLAFAATHGDKPAADALEDTLLATLVLARRMDWTTMTEIIRRVKTPEDLADFATRILETPERYPLYFTCTVLADDYTPVAAFLRKHPGPEGIDSLKAAMKRGAGSLKTLFAQGRTVYHAPRILAWLDKPLSWARPTFLTPLTMRYPHALLAAKITILFASGLAIALTLSSICRVAWCVPCEKLRRRRCLPLLAKLFFAGSFTIFIWLVLEPNLLRFTTEKPARAIFTIGTALAGQLPHKQAMNANSLDQASILSLIFFFLVQLVIYVFSMMRLSRLRAMDIPASTKIKLLENDENLFDLGLYIGLAGTVTSLLMLAMNIIQASLVAAYSSTLFGILFVASFKVINIRTYRRELIIQAENETTAKQS